LQQLHEETLRVVVGGQPQPATELQGWLEQQAPELLMYVVDCTVGRCSCPDFAFHRLACKHIFAVMAATGTRWADLPATLREHQRMRLDNEALFYAVGTGVSQPADADTNDSSKGRGEEGSEEELAGRIMDEPQLQPALDADDSGAVDDDAADDVWEVGAELGDEAGAGQSDVEGAT
jgi:hypothetical protein